MNLTEYEALSMSTSPGHVTTVLINYSEIKNRLSNSFQRIPYCRHLGSSAREEAVKTKSNHCALEEPPHACYAFMGFYHLLKQFGLVDEIISKR